MDLRKIVRERMEELGLNVRQLAERAKLRPTTLYDFCRDPKDMKKYEDGKTRHGNLNSDALAAVLKALDLVVVAKK